MIGKQRVLLLDSQTRSSQIGATARGPQFPEKAKRLLEQHKTTRNAPRVPSNYGLFKETPLHVEVHTGPQTLDINIP